MLKFLVNRVLCVMLALIAVLTLSMSVSAAVYTDEIELETRSIILVDRSGSMEDRERVDEILQETNPDGEIPVAYFDSHGITTDSSYTGGWDSTICESIDDAVTGGFTHITVITDGEQWPADYSSLGMYTDVNIRIVLTEEQTSSEGLDEAPKALVQNLLDHLSHSSLTVQLLGGEEIVYLDEYQVPKYTVSIEVPETTDGTNDTDATNGTGTDGTGTNGDNGVDGINGTNGTGTNGDNGANGINGTNGTGTNGDNGANGINGNDGTACRCSSQKSGNCKWWLALLLGFILAALCDFIHELITRGSGWEKPVTAKVRKGARMLLDVSGSMSSYADDVVRVARKGKASALLAFGETVQEVLLSEVATLQNGGATLGTEALLQASRNHWEEIVMVSDLWFNGKTLDPAEFQQKFKTITLVVPDKYNVGMVTELQNIADRVEVLSL